MAQGKGGEVLSRSGRRWRLAMALVAMAAVVAAEFGWSPLAILASRLTIATHDIIADVRPDEVHETVFPHQPEICATSQWRKLTDGQGNPFGHAVIYVKAPDVTPRPPIRSFVAVRSVGTD
jgi:hypothetical protein